MATEFKTDGTLNLSCMLGTYDTKPLGSPLWAEAFALHVQSSVDHLTRDEGEWTGPKRVVRVLNDALKSDPHPWQVFPPEAEGNPEIWMQMITGISWDELGNLIERRSPGNWAVIAAEQAKWEAEHRLPGAPKGNQNAAIGIEQSASKKIKRERDHDSAKGIRRRLQKRANAGDMQAFRLVKSLRAGIISVNQAAVAAGMRQKYIRLRTDDSEKAAHSILEREGKDFAVDLAEKILANAEDYAFKPLQVIQLPTGRNTDQPIRQ